MNLEEIESFSDNTYLDPEYFDKIGASLHPGHVRLWLDCAFVGLTLGVLWLKSHQHHCLHLAVAGVCFW